MAEIENVGSVKEIADSIAEEDTNNAGESAQENVIEDQLDDIAKEVQQMEEVTPKLVPKLQVLENKIIKSASPQCDVEKAISQIQTMPAAPRGRPRKSEAIKETESVSDTANGKESTPMFTGRNKLRRTFVTPDELDKELEATMEKLEPGSSVQVTKNGSQGRSIQDQDLIAILEGNDNAEVVTDETDKKINEVELDMLDVAEEGAAECEAEIALQQMMSLPKVKRGRKAKHDVTHNASDIVSSIVDDWSDNEIEYEVTATESKTNNETTITISPAARKPSSNKSGAAKRKQPQGLVADVAGSGSVEIIQTVEPPRIINKDAGKVTTPIKFERRRVIKKKVIWDPDDPTPPISTRIGNTTIKKITAVKEVVEKDLPEKKPVTVAVNKRKRAGKSEIDKLLGDEGAVNMIYSVERENNSELPEIKTAVEDQQIDVEEEQNNLLKKANALKKAVIKQTKSPPNSIPARAARAKRAPTPTPPTTSVSPASASTATTTSTATATPTKKQTPAKKRKSANASWDYVYKARQNDDSMIVRRRSNSSYSSTTSPRRLSLDQSQLSDSADAPTASPNTASPADAPSETPPPTKKQRGKNFEFAKPSAKKSANKKPLDTSKLVEQIRGKLKPKPMMNLSPAKTMPGGSVSPDSLKRKALDSKQLSIKKYDKFAFLILPSIDGKVKDCLTLQVSNKFYSYLV